ncbi:MAG: hypothetical protein JWR16_852, partial [Nevskia sp.]|nr:hypothetical protein [Nevskia sp.]
YGDQHFEQGQPGLRAYVVHLQVHENVVAFGFLMETRPAV